MVEKKSVTNVTKALSDFVGGKPESEVKSDKGKNMSSLYLGVALIVFIGLLFFGAYSSVQISPSANPSAGEDNVPLVSTPDDNNFVDIAPSEEEPVVDGIVNPVIEAENDETGGLVLSDVPLTNYVPKANEFIVEITRGEFSPKIVTVKKGATVTWINKDTKSHKVAARDRTFYGTKLSPGDTYSYTFEEAGEHEYFDVIFYKTMKGTIIVDDDNVLGATGYFAAGFASGRNAALAVLMFLLLVVFARISLSVVEVSHYHLRVH